MIKTPSFFASVYITIILVAVLVLVLNWSTLTGFIRKEKVESYQFAGIITKIEDNRLYLKGSFVVSEGSTGDYNGSVIEAIVKITNKTEIIKNTIYLPSQNEVGPNGTYKVSDLKKEQTVIMLANLTVNKSVMVTSSKNIFGKQSFNAEKIEYVEPIYPKN